jgi:hypothetical protein
LSKRLDLQRQLPQGFGDLLGISKWRLVPAQISSCLLVKQQPFATKTVVNQHNTSIMNSIKRALLLTLLASCALTTRAQEHRYAVVEYMHIPEGKSDDTYLATEKLWQRLHQRAVDAGICRAWYLERVANGGRGDFVTVRVYNSLDALSNPWPEAIRKNLFNAEETTKMGHTTETRELIHRELWEFEASAAQTPGGDPSTFVYVQFMKAKEGKESEYFKMEKDTFTKVHQARIKSGEMKNWHFMTRLFPSGTDSAYDFITINVYPKVDPVWDTKIIEKALGKEEAAKLVNPGAVRTMVREELWRPILATTPTK